MKWQKTRFSTPILSSYNRLETLNTVTYRLNYLASGPLLGPLANFRRILTIYN